MREPAEERKLRNRATLAILDENQAKDLKKRCVKDGILRKTQEEDKIPKMPGGKPYAGVWFIQNKQGVVFFRDTDMVAKLYIPKDLRT